MNTKNTPTPRTDEAAWIEADVVEASFARELETELALVTEQLDAAQKELAEKEDCIDIWMQEAMNFAEQRDRLAEALRVINTYDPKNGQCEDGYSPVFHARKALQSLNQDHTVASDDMIAAMKGGSDES